MDELVARVARQIEERYYGKYRGLVTDNADPEKRGRVRLRVPSVLGDQETAWALPCVPFGGLAGQGLFLAPEPNAQVWVEFEEGDVGRPICVGTFWQQTADVPAPAALVPPTTRLLQTPAGHVLQLDDAQGAERIRIAHRSGAELAMDAQGGLSATDANGNKVQLGAAGIVLEDSNGNRIEMGTAGITLQATRIALGGAGGEPLAKGMSLATLIGAHLHTSGGPGAPTTPPLPPADAGSLPAQILSTVVTVT